MEFEQKCVKTKNKDAIEQKIFNDMLQRGLICNLLKNHVEKEPLNNEILAIAGLFNNISNESRACNVDELLKEQKPKKPRKKRVLTESHIQALKEARQKKLALKQVNPSDDSP